MNYFLPFLFTGLLCFSQAARAQQHLAGSSRYIAGATKDTVYITTGRAYAFDVDTPEHAGLVSTTPLVPQLLATLPNPGNYSIHTSAGLPKTTGMVVTGDKLIVRAPGGGVSTYEVVLSKGAPGGQLVAEQASRTVNTTGDLVLQYTAGQRSPDATVTFYLPEGIKAGMENTRVNLIGRGDVLLKDFEQQPTGRTGTGYPYSKPGTVRISGNGRQIVFEHLDLRPANGADIRLRLQGVRFSKTGTYLFKAGYTTSQPEVLTGVKAGTAVTVTRTVSDLQRLADTATAYTAARLKWAPAALPGVVVEQSPDGGTTWSRARAVMNIAGGQAALEGLRPGVRYLFRLRVSGGAHRGASNTVAFYSGKMDIKNFGLTGSGGQDDTEKINAAIDSVHRMGGGTLLFSRGVYNVRTVHLKSNVWLYVDKEATIQALKSGDAPEITWFSSKKYRSGLSPTDMGPYADPENWMTKQDVGHTYFNNAMFTATREDNIKITGNGYITGNGNLVTSDKVMNNAPDNRSDKMFSFKLCSRIEIGGIYRREDLWYDSAADAPFYILENKRQDFDTDNMLKIDRAGHFVLLATGTDHINVHDTYFAKYHSTNARDIYDFMDCSHVTVTNIYSKVSSDDIVKPGSDCSLGFTRPAKNYRVRNIIGDTNCNLFQVGSETADDITDICIDNIYVLGANKAGFSISTNDGGHIGNIHLNCGETGSLHHRSKMLRTYTPFFISISNRGRVLGATARRFRFTENGTERDELLVTNVNIGRVENIVLNGVDVSEVYAGSSFGKNDKRWAAFNGTQRTATPIIAGYRLPQAAAVQGGLSFRLPNGMHTGYITNITFNDVQLLVKGGTRLRIPPPTRRSWA